MEVTNIGYPGMTVSQSESSVPPFTNRDENIHSGIRI